MGNKANGLLKFLKDEYGLLELRLVDQEVIQNVSPPEAKQLRKNQIITIFCDQHLTFFCNGKQSNLFDPIQFL
jgi:hypothetical protein